MVSFSGSAFCKLVSLLVEANVGMSLCPVKEEFEGRGGGKGVEVLDKNLGKILRGVGGRGGDGGHSGLRIKAEVYVRE